MSKKTMMMNVKQLNCFGNMMNASVPNEMNALRKMRKVFEALNEAKKPYKTATDPLFAKGDEIHAEFVLLLNKNNLANTLNEKGRASKTILDIPWLTEEQIAEYKKILALDEQLEAVNKEIDALMDNEGEFSLDSKLIAYAAGVFEASIEYLSKQGHKNVQGEGNIRLLGEVDDILNIALYGEPKQPTFDEADETSEEKSA